MSATRIAMVVVAGLVAPAVVAQPAVQTANSAPTTLPAASAAAPASAAVAPSTVDVRAKRGYWFYEKPAEKVEAAPIEPEPAPPMPPPPPEDKLLQMHPKQVEKLIGDYREYALYTMKPEHVRWYYQMQDYARRRSRAFMNVTEMVMLNSPDLNMNTVYPTNTPGNNARVSRREAVVQSRLQKEAPKAALVLLTTQSCTFCEAQRSTIKYFQQKHGWQVREFDLKERPEMVAKFGTSYTPTTVVIFRETGEWMPVAVGVDTLPRLEESVYRSVRAINGETTPEQFTTNEDQDGGVLDPQRN